MVKYILHWNIKMNIRKIPNKNIILFKIQEFKNIKDCIKYFNCDYRTFHKWLKYHNIIHNFHIGKKSYLKGKKLPEYVKNKISKTRRNNIKNKEAKLDRIVCKCETCGNDYINVPSAISRQLNKKYCSRTCSIEGQCNKIKGTNNPMYGKTHSPETIKKIFSHRKMNKLEKIVADFLDKNNIRYIFQFFINQDGICKSYDFKIKDKPIIIEVDGDFWHGHKNNINNGRVWKNYKNVQSNDKLKNKIAKSNGYSIIRIWESEIKKGMMEKIICLN